MGVNVIIYRGDSFDEHPDWDWIRHSGDRDMQRILSETGAEQRQVGHPMDCEFRERPTNPERFVEAMVLAFPENEARWRRLGQILNEPEWWIYFSW